MKRKLFLNSKFTVKFWSIKKIVEKYFSLAADMKMAQTLLRENTICNKRFIRILISGTIQGNSQDADLFCIISFLLWRGIVSVPITQKLFESSCGPKSSTAVHRVPKHVQRAGQFAGFILKNSKTNSFQIPPSLSGREEVLNGARSVESWRRDRNANPSHSEVQTARQ